MEKQLTPVEWFFRELENVNGYSAFYTNNYQHVDALYNEAKQMENETIQYFFKSGHLYSGCPSGLEELYTKIFNK
jgi:hypothetical protein